MGPILIFHLLFGLFGGCHSGGAFSRGAMGPYPEPNRVNPDQLECLVELLLKWRIVKTKLDGEMVKGMEKKWPFQWETETTDGKWEFHRRIRRQPEMDKWRIYAEKMEKLLDKTTADKCFALNWRIMQHDSKRNEKFLQFSKIFELTEYLEVPKEDSWKLDDLMECLLDFVGKYKGFNNFVEIKVPKMIKTETDAIVDEYKLRAYPHVALQWTWKEEEASSAWIFRKGIDEGFNELEKCHQMSLLKDKKFEKDASGLEYIDAMKLFGYFHNGQQFHGLEYIDAMKLFGYFHDGQLFLRHLPPKIGKKIAFEQIVEENNKECGICLEEFDKDEDVGKLKQYPCKHIFHEHCIDKWLFEHEDCPFCRAKINIIVKEKKPAPAPQPIHSDTVNRGMLHLQQMGWGMAKK